ncbi:hypothetical protein BDR04DRAFT_226164 [Suillus decipiens]|nr:hypothetical protein BDR04DRAFT_226164 [Suillus decipiens]
MRRSRPTPSQCMFSSFGSLSTNPDGAPASRSQSSRILIFWLACVMLTAFQSLAIQQ